MIYHELTVDKDVAMQPSNSRRFLLKLVGFLVNSNELLLMFLTKIPIAFICLDMPIDGDPDT